MNVILSKIVNLCVSGIMLWPFFASAGTVEDLRVLWVNLDITDPTTDPIIFNAVKIGCHSMNEKLIMYVRKRPPELTNELVSKAFVSKDAVALRQLKRALVAFRDENLPGPKGDQIKGLDGILVYTSKPYPRLLTLTTPRHRDKRVMSIKIKTPFDDAEFQGEFCSMLPDLTREP